MTCLEAIRRLVVDHRVSCVVTSSARGEPRIIHVNPAFCRMTGYSPSEAEGSSPKMLQGKATEQNAVSRVQEAMIAGRPIRLIQTNYRKTSEAYLCEMALFPLDGEHEEVTRFIAFEREVRRKRGRPAMDGNRFRPVHEDQAGFRELFDVEA